MKAAVVSKYGSTDFVEINDIEKPEIGKEEILVKVHVAAVTSADSRIRRAKFPKGFTIPAKLIYGINRPRIKTVGCIFSGVVEQVGSAVTHFAVGDEVCGSTGLKIGMHMRNI
ncbi:MAG: alcohol dehydrogenase catalytic domain-containing protein [Acidimicrobiia bacterium]